MMSPPPNSLEDIQPEEAVEPRDWKRAGVLIAFQPFNWALGIDRSQWRAISFDLGCFRFTVGLP